MDADFDRKLAQVLAEELARLRGLIAKELQREFPGAIVRPLPEGGWVAVYGDRSITARDAAMLRAKLAVVRTRA